MGEKASPWNMRMSQRSTPLPPWPELDSPETTPIKLRAHATSMMNTPERRNANSVERRMRRPMTRPPDALAGISPCSPGGLPARSDGFRDRGSEDLLRRERLGLGWGVSTAAWPSSRAAAAGTGAPPALEPRRKGPTVALQANPGRPPPETPVRPAE